MVNSISANIFQSRPKPLFWEVRLNLYIKGNYLFHDQSRNLEGSYSGHFRWQGLMEPDEPDIILYHWQSEVVSWQVSEKEKREDQEMTVSRSSNPPQLKVGTFLRQEEAFWLDFILENPPDSFSPSLIEPKIILPASFIRNLIFNGLRYNDYLKNGSNKISVPVNEMNQPELRRNFSWLWSYPSNYPHLDLNELGTEHKVDVELYIKSHYKKTLRFTPEDDNGHKLRATICGLNGYKSE